MYIRKVNHKADQALLAQVWEWAQANPRAYLEGTSYTSFVDFSQAPDRAVECFVFIGDQIAALLTFYRQPMAAEIYKVGLIVNPHASKRKLFALLLGFREKVFEYAAALIVTLPCEMKAARKLALKFGFSPLSETELILFRS
jgi:hypothetical protein